MSDLPRGWELPNIADAGETRLGKQRAPKWHTGPNMRPYLRVANVFEDRIDVSDVKSMHFEPHEVVTFELRPGDVLLNEGQSPEFLGRPAIYRGELPGVCFTNSLVRFRPYPGVLSEWALTVFRHHMHSGRFRTESQITTNIAHLSLGRLNTVEFPLPPTAEQRRIVAAIEEQFSRLDAADASLGNVPQRLNRFRQSLLRDAFDIGWDRVPITAVTSAERVIRYGILKPGKDVARGVPVVKVRDYPQGEIRVDSLSRTTPEISARFEAATLRPGDVLISIRGTYGRVAPVPDVLDRANITQDSARIAPLPSIHRGFLVHFLRSPECQSFLRRVARGVAVKGVNIRDLRQLPVPVPDLATQARVAEKLDDQLSLHGHLSGELAKARRATRVLRLSILAAGFSGQLVSQDPNDEPSVVLLERIRAEQATTTLSKRKQKATSL